MTSVKKKLVCIICFTRFDGESIPIPQKNSNVDATTVPKTQEQDEEKESTCDSKGNINLYERFLQFVSQYFNLGNYTGRFIACAKEAKNEDGGPAKLETFCESCGALVREICGLYKQLRTAQLFLVWKLGQVGELMKKGSVPAGPKSRPPYQVTSALTKAISKQMNLDAGSPVGAFRKVLQLKCINAKRKGLPDVVVHRGLFPDQWKFTYSVTKQTLIRLITVFLLASSQIIKSNHTQPSIGENDAGEQLVNMRPRRKARKTVKFSPTPNTPDDDHNGDDEHSHDDNLVDNHGNVSDSDWSQGAASPISVDANVSLSLLNEKTENYRKSKAKWNLRNRRNVVVIAEEEGVGDSSNSKYSNDHRSLNPKKGIKRQYRQHPQEVANPRQVQMLHRSYVHCFKRVLATQRIHPLAKPSSCRKCSEVILTRREMRLHMKTVHQSDTPDRAPVVRPIAKLECPYCFQRIVTEKRFKIHIDIHENKAVNELDHWYCQVCGQHNYSENSLKVHMKEIHQDKYVCIVCNEELENGNFLRDHLLENHETEEKPFRCPYCRKRFTTQQSYDIHRTLVHCDKRKFACDFKTCNLYFDSIMEMSEHLKHHLDDSKLDMEMEMFRCETCEVKFLKKYSLTLHQLMHTSESNTGNGYDCPKCNKNVGSKELLVIHYKFVHGYFDRSEKRYQCKICEKRFSNKVWFSTHVRLHEVSLFEEKIVCEICDVICVDSIALEAHRQRYHEETNPIPGHGGRVAMESHSKLKKGTVKTIWMSERDTETRFDPASPPPPGKISKKTTLAVKDDIILIKFPCNVENCGEISESAYLLRKHLETEHEADKPDNEKNIYCYYCHRRFFYKQTRELHERAQHKKKITVKFKCDLERCQITKCFYPVEQLNEHLESHLGNEANSSKEISFCSKCNWGFMRPEVRDLHELIHIQPREDGKLKCPSCESLFNPFSSLHCHYNRVHGVNLKPIKCGKCNRAYFTKQALRKHFLTVHLGIKVNRGKDNRPRKGRVGATKDKPLEIFKKVLNEPIICDAPKCGKKFTTNKAFLSHKKCQHGKKEWVCEVCGYSCTLRCKLKYHMNRHTHENRNLACDECGKLFTRQSNLKEHKEKHNPNRIQNSICATCGKSFFTSGGLRMHFESTHKPESEWRLKCPKCPRRFFRRMLLNLHLKMCDGKGKKVESMENVEDGGSGSTSNGLPRRSAREKKKKRNWSDEEEELTDKSTTEDEMDEDKLEIKTSTLSNIFQQAAQNGVQDLLRLPFQQPVASHQLQHDHDPPQMETDGGMTTVTTIGIPSLSGPSQALTTLPLLHYPQMHYCIEQRQLLSEQPVIENSPETNYQSPTSSL